MKIFLNLKMGPFNLKFNLMKKCYQMCVYIYRERF